MLVVGGIRLFRRWDDFMQRVRLDAPIDAFDIAIEHTIDFQNQSANVKVPTFDSQTPLSDNKVMHEIAVSECKNLSETSSPEENHSSTSNTGEVEPHIPLEVETMAILSSMLEDEEFDTGVSNASEKYFEKVIHENKVSAMNGISALFMDNFSVQGRKVNVLIGILHILSHCEYTLVYPLGQMIAICALSHANSEVEEFGIKCFEDWGHKDGIEKLRAIKFNSDWLQDYAKEVISELSVGD